VRGGLDVGEAAADDPATRPALWRGAAGGALRKRQYRCRERACPRKAFTESIAEVPLRAR
jgi:hypothetical protein